MTIFTCFSVVLFSFNCKVFLSFAEDTAHPYPQPLLFSFYSFRFTKMCSHLSAEKLHASTKSLHRYECKRRVEITQKSTVPIRSKRSTATVSKARRIIGCSSSTSLKLSTLREYRRQYVSARTLAVLRPRVSKQISACGR